MPRLVQMLFPGRIWTASKKDRSVYLTFDDGPIPEVTPWVLEQLAAYNAKATFFCIGDNIRKYPEIFKQVLDAGHAVGNHTFNHLNGWKTSSQVYLENSLKAQEILQKLTPEARLQPPLFRPPYGKMTHRQAKLLRKQGYKIVMWSIISRDFDQKISPEICYNNVLKHLEPGSIVVFHDSLKAQKNLRATLPLILEYGHNKGYSFKSLSA